MDIFPDVATYAGIRETTAAAETPEDLIGVIMTTTSSPVLFCRSRKARLCLRPHRPAAAGRFCWAAPMRAVISL